ncbi:hypothetical protein A6R79_18965 [Xanthomonas translucens pv. translucens]|nr:hypothetical protein A6R79_18965 [Xanthomonas translucens pv. translucens]
MAEHAAAEHTVAQAEGAQFAARGEIAGVALAAGVQVVVQQRAGRTGRRQRRAAVLCVDPGQRHVEQRHRRIDR